MLITFILFICIPATIIVLILLVVEAVKHYLARRRSGKAAIGEAYFTNFRKVVIAIFIFYAVLFPGIIIYDENLDPPIAKALATPPPDIFYPGNGWLALLGFTSPAGGPPFAREEKRLRAIKAAFLKDGDVGCNDDVADAEQRDELSCLGKLPELYTRKNNGIWEYASAHPVEVDRLLRDNSELLGRYEKLYNYHQYTEPLDFGYCTPYLKFVPVRNIQKVKFLHLAQVAQQGNVRGALLELQKDADFWRRIAINSKTMFSKLISLSMLSADLLFVAELGVQMDPDLEDEWEIVRTILRPFGQGEMAFKSALEGEALFSLLSFKSIYSAAKEDPMSNSALLKPNATRNRMYSYYQERMALAEMTPRDFAGSMALKEMDSPRIRNWSALYNPVGEILNSIAQPNIAGYIAKGHRLECLRRLALLKILAGTERLKSEEMQRFLDAHQAEYGNPYTGESMKWDAQKNRIYLKQVGEDKEVEIY